eukprot:TRINITY_DN5672_c0_g1_i1.p1 TRINITY_DN5672_c0_g1~~TRINITY_DN5672_c0_g1_i1.p1  ORF type:complete len:196 (+),score=33.25 TRINITY_DN5672_c0_g1_i1:121-708(+)
MTLLQECVEFDRECGFQIPTAQVGGCDVLIQPDGCHTSCSIGCEFVYVDDCGASCQPEVFFNISVATPTKKLLLVETPQERANTIIVEIAGVVEIDSDRFVIVFVEDHGTFIIIGVKILVFAGSVTTDIFVDIATLFETGIVGTGLGEVTEISCTSGCDYTRFDGKTTIPPPTSYPYIGCYADRLSTRPCNAGER